MRTLFLIIAAVVAVLMGIFYFGVREIIIIENPEEGADWT